MQKSHLKQNPRKNFLSEMKIPNNYPSKLSKILDIHCDEGETPSWYCVNYLNIKKDFDYFIKQKKIRKKIEILDVFGNSVSYANNSVIKKVYLFEKRKKYIAASLKLHGKKIEIIRDINKFNLNYDLMFVNFELAGLLDYNKFVPIKYLIERKPKLIAYTFNKPFGLFHKKNVIKTNEKIIIRNSDGDLFNKSLEKNSIKLFKDIYNKKIVIKKFKFVNFYEF